LLDDAGVEAMKASLRERAALLTAIGRTQVDSRDFVGAERTLGLLRAEDSPGGALRESGEPEWFAMLSRANLATRLICEFRTGGHPDAALATVRRLPAGEQREWLLAHEAVMTLRSTRADTTVPATPLLDRWRAARAIVREITLADVRLDALLQIAEAAQDTGGGQAVLRDAYMDARTIRIRDADRQASRNAMLAVVALRLSRESDVTALFERLTRADDIQYVFSAAAQRPRFNRLARALAPRAIGAAEQLQDTAARTVYLATVHESLRQVVGETEADRLVPQMSNVRRASSPADRDSAKAHSIYPQDRAVAALYRGDFAEVRRQAEGVPLSRTGAERAMVWQTLAWLEYMSSMDTARVYLRLATEALRRGGAGSARDSTDYDSAIYAIARNDFWFGDVLEGIALLDAAFRPADVAGAVLEWGASTSRRPPLDSSRAAIAQVGNSALRDALLARFVEIELVPENIARARIVADSIDSIESRARAGLAVAAGLQRMHRDEEARSLLVALLARESLVDAQLRSRVIAALIAAAGSRDAESWARGPAPTAADKARRLLAVATAMNHAIQAAARGPFYNLSGNGPDACLDLF